MLKTRTSSEAYFEGLLELAATHGEMRTHIVLSRQYDARPVTAVAIDRSVRYSAGWQNGSDTPNISHDELHS